MIKELKIQIDEEKKEVYFYFNGALRKVMHYKKKISTVIREFLKVNFKE